jgi:prepilin-type N-terminal cleavage/methylation domain-containing protein
MMRRNKHPRAGFTLIELLVVISIIAILMGLLISGVMKVFSTSPRTETLARTKGLDAAIGTFKADRFAGKGYIPAGSHNAANGQVVGPFRLRNSYTVSSTPSINDFEAQYLIQAFSLRPIPDSNGNPALGNLGNPAMNADLDANQTLLFFLGGVPVSDGQGNFAFTGFANNPTAPFTPAQSGESRKGPYIDITRKFYQVAPNGFAWLVDGYGQPFAYFTSFNGRGGTMSGANGGLLPYTNGGKFVNDTGWQIISAGQDKSFGVTNNWSSLDAQSQDNLANFSTKILGAGPTAQ